jgi:chemotaxis protein MotD
MIAKGLMNTGTTHVATKQNAFAGNAKISDAEFRDMLEKTKPRSRGDEVNKPAQKQPNSALNQWRPTTDAAAGAFSGNPVSRGKGTANGLEEEGQLKDFPAEIPSIRSHETDVPVVNAIVPESDMRAAQTGGPDTEADADGQPDLHTVAAGDRKGPAVLPELSYRVEALDGITNRTLLNNSITSPPASGAVDPATTNTNSGPDGMPALQARQAPGAAVAVSGNGSVGTALAASLSGPGPLPVETDGKNRKGSERARSSSETVRSTQAIRGLTENPGTGAVAERTPGSTHTDTGIRNSNAPRDESRHDELKRNTASARITGETSPDVSKPASVSGAAVSINDPKPITAARQIAEVVSRDLAELGLARMNVTSNGAPGKMVKTLRLQLNPIELGAVNVKMQSVAGELRLTISAESEQTARMLARDSDAIKSALRSAGIAGPDVSIIVPRGDQSQIQTFNDQNRGPANQQMGSQENRGSTPNESRQSHRETSGNETTRNSVLRDDADAGRDRGDSRLYI